MFMCVSVHSAQDYQDFKYKMVPTMLVEQKLLTRDRIKLHRKNYIGLHLAKS